MPYVFGGLVVLNAVVLSYYLFLKPPAVSSSVEQAQAAIAAPIEFSNSATFIPPPIGKKE